MRKLLLPLLLAASFAAGARDNPLLQPSTLPLGYPHFDQLQDADFAPALQAGMALHWREVDTILRNPAAPTFENTVEAMERAGRLLGRTQNMLGSLSGTDNNPSRQALQQRFAPEMAAHRDRIAMDPRLFARIDSLLKAKPKLDAEQQRLLERMHRNLRRAGAELPPDKQQRLREINSELAQMGAEFNRKVQAGVNDAALFITDRAALTGLSDAEIDALKQADGRFRIALQNTTGQPLLHRLQHRPLREQLYKASIARGSQGDANDTTALVSRFAALRAERAALLGFATYADFELQEQTAKEVKTVNALLRQLAPAAVASARKEQAALQQLADQEQDAAGKPRFALQAWDWDFYSERLRAVQHGYDGEQLRPYLELQTVLERGVFHAATELFGLTFKRRHDLPIYHPDVQVWEVFAPNGKTQALLLFDFYARPTKRGGAWANGYVRQSRLFGEKPVVGNHMNIPKPAAGQPTLLTWDETKTLFHEFGHNLHSMLSDIRYPGLAGTPRDYVEFPSQVNEMWQTWPSVFKHYARHHQTGAPMPEALLNKVLGAGTFNQGFATTEYLGATLLDQRWHQLSLAEVPKPEMVMAFEARVLEQEGFGPGQTLVAPRYRSPYFSHMVGGYSAGYYSYLWSELLDATTVEWIEKNGGLSRPVGEQLKRHVFSIGGSKDIMAEFETMVGSKPKLEPYLKRRGLSLNK
ncbi:M3 family metallopeptidase [Paucibacter sp. TC2R-5]|uniref:M3 family metallopeptidase n=1 Tax=Paucibacter sp. TC2R-5 TaxID=2893555 RepID=UPI0021E43A92|nr:M3 family metallopeptidase [Paucibacter sp. TC2R-5]MCV2357489.1 M3 family metallopeptidase [Paucibacter sp. TC2R-5]